MNAVTLKDAKLNLERLVEDVIANVEPTIVVTESGEQVVFLPLAEYNSWKETLYLLSNPANAEHLRRSIAEAQAAFRTLFGLTPVSEPIVDPIQQARVCVLASGSPSGLLLENRLLPRLRPTPRRCRRRAPRGRALRRPRPQPRA